MPLAQISGREVPWQLRWASSGLRKPPRRLDAPDTISVSLGREPNYKLGLSLQSNDKVNSATRPDSGAGARWKPPRRLDCAL